MTASRLAIHASAVLLALGCLFSNALAGQTKARSFSGMCAYYSQSGKLASGGQFNPNALTAAHRSLPFGTRVRVTDPKSGRSVIVTINDRGPFNKGRVIDISSSAARALGMTDRGIIFVRADVL
jgi:peptidoglycan lytic transglycosylase